MDTILHELAKHPIKELNEPTTKKRLLQSFERGNLHEVTFEIGDRADKMFIEANPQLNNNTFYFAIDRLLAYS